MISTVKRNQTSGQLLSRVTVVYIHVVRSDGRNTQRWNSNAVHDFHQRMNVTKGLNIMEFQCKYNTPKLRERLSLDKYSILNVRIFLKKSLNTEEHIETTQ